MNVVVLFGLFAAVYCVVGVPSIPSLEPKFPYIPYDDGAQCFGEDCVCYYEGEDSDVMDEVTVPSRRVVPNPNRGTAAMSGGMTGSSDSTTQSGPGTAFDGGCINGQQRVGDTCVTPDD